MDVKINIGVTEDVPEGSRTAATVQFDLWKLLLTRLLVAADSGGGKSYLLRLLMERAFGKVQSAVIDPEGEFASLREKYDFLLISGGKGRDAKASALTAEPMAREVLKANASVICDLFDLSDDEQHAWVRGFLRGLRKAPRELWRPFLVAIDEAEIFAPENGQGESEALPEVMALSKRGRKRGLCGALFVQRLARLSKNAASGLKNKVIGMTDLEIDLDRAGDEMGKRKGRAHREEFYEALRGLEAGRFFMRGPAVSKDPILVDVDRVATSHPEPGAPRMEPPPPTAKIRAILAKLEVVEAAGDDDSEAAPEVVVKLRDNICELVAQRGNLERELADLRESGVPGLKAEVARLRKTIVDLGGITPGEVRRLRAQDDEVDRFVRAMAKAGKNVAVVADGSRPPVASFTVDPASRTVSVDPPALAPVRGEIISAPRAADPEGAGRGPSDLPRGAVALLGAIAYYPDGLTPEALTIVVGYKKTSRDKYLAQLRAAGAVASGEQGRVCATAAGHRALSGADLPVPWSFMSAGERAILTAIARGGVTVTPEQLTLLTGYKKTARDKYLSRLRAVEFLGRGRGILEVTARGMEALGGSVEVLPTGADLLRHWLAILPQGERRVLEIVARMFPESIDRETVGTMTGYKKTARDKYLSQLGTRRLVESRAGSVRASETLFDATEAA